MAAENATLGGVSQTQRIQRDAARITRLREAIAKAEERGQTERAAELTAELEARTLNLQNIRETLNAVLPE